MVLWLLWGAEAPTALQTELTPQQIGDIKTKKHLLLGCMQGGYIHQGRHGILPLLHDEWITVDSHDLYSEFEEAQRREFITPEEVARAVADPNYQPVKQRISAEAWLKQNHYPDVEYVKHVKPDILYDLKNPQNLFAPLQNSLDIIVSEGLPTTLFTQIFINSAYGALKDGGYLVFLGSRPVTSQRELAQLARGLQTLDLLVSMNGFEKFDIKQRGWWPEELIRAVDDLGGLDEQPLEKWTFYRKIPRGAGI